MRNYSKKLKPSLLILLIIFPLFLLSNASAYFIKGDLKDERGIYLSASNYTLGYSVGDTFIFTITVYDSAKLEALSINIGSNAKVGAMRCYEITKIYIENDDWFITYTPWNWVDDINAFYSPSRYEEDYIIVYNNTADFGSNKKLIHSDIMSIVGKPVKTYLSLIDWDPSVTLNNYTVIWNEGLYSVTYIYNQEGILNDYIVKQTGTEILHISYTGARPPQDLTSLIILIIILISAAVAGVIIVIFVIKKRKTSVPKVKIKKEKKVKPEPRPESEMKSTGVMSPKELAELEKRERSRRKQQAKIARAQALKEADRYNVEVVAAAKQNLKKAKSMLKQKGLDYADKINAKTEIMKAQKALALAVKEAQEKVTTAKTAGASAAVGLSKDMKKSRVKEKDDIKKIDKQLKGKLKKTAKSEKRIETLIEQEQIEKVTITEKCPECFWVLSSSATKCPRCGWIKPVKEYKPKPKSVSTQDKFVAEGNKLCPICGKIIGQELQFCKYCGQDTITVTKKICYNCNQAIDKELEICSNCGADVTEEPPVQQAPEPTQAPVAAAPEPEDTSIQDQIDELNKEIADTHKQIDVVNEEYYAQTISQEKYLEEKNRLYEKLGQLQGKLMLLNP